MPDDVSHDPGEANAPDSKLQSLFSLVLWGSDGPPADVLGRHGWGFPCVEDDGQGVNGAIHRAAGPDLEAHCMTLNGCCVGEAKVTPGFGLPSDWVIHTVAPRWHDGTDGEPLLLGWCYQACLSCADEVGAESVAFPALGAGARGVPPEAAAWIAVNAVCSTPTLVRSIRFVCRDTATWAAFQSAIREETEDT